MALELTEDRPPLPPADLMLRVLPPFGADNLDNVRRSFDLEALTHLGCYERALAAVGRSLEDFDRLLDFGCGCGRFLRHFGAIADQVEINGTDIDAKMIEWLRANVPYGSYDVAPHEPPLPYPDHHFDLVINHSVFSHLDERMQDLWLGELRRITRPGGLLLLTVEGQSSWNRTAAACEVGGEDPERWRTELESRGILFISDDLFVGSSHPDFYHSAIHAPWYVLEHWTQFFDVAAFIPDGSLSQDLIVLRRWADDAVPPRPIGRRLAGSAPTGATVRGAGAPAPADQRDTTASARRLGHRATAAVRRLARARQAAPASRPDGFDAEAVAREIAMLRVGLYEQGKRISVVAAELRDEIEASRDGGADEGA
jgi:SAM-dependent methyltransferase